MGRGEREDGNQNRRQITLHSFRRFVKTTISDLGYFDFSEYFIGRSGSTYWRKKDSEKAVDKFGKEVDRLTSELPEGSATDQFVDRWKALRKRLDDMKDKLPTS
jgi:hypothetical protein